MLDLDPLAPRTPRLPNRRLGALAQLVISTALHLTLVGITALIGTTLARVVDPRLAEPMVDQQRPDVRHLVFLAPELPLTGRGGGGGGNQQQDPVSRAHGRGTDTMTLRVRHPPPPTTPVSAPAVEDMPALPSVVLDAKPLASGFFDQVGPPIGAVMSGTSTGPGSGGGVGSGSGTGMGSGHGPGFGPGSGGGTGGGVYRAGGIISAPRLIKSVTPKYTNEALVDKIQGTVVLEAVVTEDGYASQIRVVRSLDAGGLDEEAVTAVTQWRFEAGRLGDTPVKVLVTIVLSFSLR